MKSINGHRGQPLSPEHVAKMHAARVAKIPPVEVRFWAKVNKNGPIHQTLGQCWEWTARIDGEGRGRFGYENRNALAYRVGLILEGREVPADMDVDHMCRNRKCVRPEHLRVVDERTSSLENNDSPFALNAAKTECKYGHPFSGANLARVLNKHRGRWTPARVCLTCFPHARNHPRRYWLPDEQKFALESECTQPCPSEAPCR